MKDIFRKKTATNPQVKALLRRHDRVNARDLADELNEFAKGLGDPPETEPANEKKGE